ncbi:MAG TPA: OmpA family protein, partial [Spirochaetes bacterium]|nr:OmpA family protein [Spirochaetota bacterium]
INNNTQEVGLVPSPDGKGVYFSSLRPGGQGGWDIWFAPINNGVFGEPVNMPLGINSTENEAYLSIIGKTLYFCSNRKGGYGRYDIYRTTLTEDRYLSIIVKDKKTGKPLSLEMNLSTRVKQEGGQTLSQDLKKQTDEKGEAKVKYHPIVKELDIFISREGYLPHFESIAADDYRDKAKLIQLVPIEKEASFDIHAIYFDFESARIRPESLPFLKKLADYLKQQPTLKFEIIGHTDLHGSEDFNLKLSLERAKAVRDFLAGLGIDPSRFAVRGAGKSQPKVPKKGKGFDEQNRRTEFRLMGK